MQYCTTKIHIKGLSGKELEQLHSLQRLSKKLYNDTIEIVNSYYCEKGYVPAKYFVIKSLLNTAAYEELGDDFKYIAYNAIKDFERSYYKTQRSPKPNKLTAIAFLPVLYNNCIMVPNHPEIYFSIPKRLWKEKIVYAFISPICDDYLNWELGLVYLVEEKPRAFPKVYAAIDLGIENFATVVCDSGSTVIIDGRRLKNIFYFDYKNRYKEGYLSKDRISRDNKANDYIKKCVKCVICFLTENSVTHLYIGASAINAELRTRWKLQALWSDFLFSKFINDLTTKCKIEGIYIESVDEAYTSQASFIDKDIPPRHVTGRKHNFSGKRKKRGLYVSKDGITINADVNGALNILVKGCLYNRSVYSHLQDNPKLIKTPKRIDPLRVGG